MPRSYTRHTKESLAPIVASSMSYAECLRKLNIKAIGGNYKHLQQNIDKFNLDTSHMTHEAWSRGKELIPLEGLTRQSSIKKRIIKSLGHFCQKCGIHTWQDQPLTLELEHIDGNNRNNLRENLTLLCPNCHSQTKTWRNRKR